MIPRASLAALLASHLAVGLACGVETTYEDVHPILESRCNSCHVDGVSTYRPYFGDYETVSGLARTLRDTVTSREMPPFGMDNTTLCGNNYFADEGLWLSDLELETLSEWVDQGTPRGGEVSKPAQVERYVEPELAHVDATIDIGEPYAPIGFDPDSHHRCFLADPDLGDKAFLSGFEVEPGNRFAVQSVALYALDDSEVQAAAAAALDAEDEPPGYYCYGGAGVEGARFLGTWVWGREVVRFPEGTGIRLEPQSRIVVQVHYNPQGGSLHPDEDMTTVNLELVDQATEASYVTLSAAGFSLRPGVDDAVARGYLVVDQPFTILGVAPLMHQTGVGMEVTRVRPFSETCLARVNHWEFYNHLRLYQYFTPPPQVFAGDQLSIECQFETQSRIEPTREGQGPSDEQCVARLYTVR